MGLLFVQRRGVLEELLRKFVVINEKLEVVVMDTIGDAYKLGCTAFGLGNFLIQEAVERRPECIRTTANPVLKGIRVVMTDKGPGPIDLFKKELNP